MQHGLRKLVPDAAFLTEEETVLQSKGTYQWIIYPLDGTTNFLTLGPEWTQNQVFRVVVVPADNVDGIDVSNINNVMEIANIESFTRL